MEVNVFSDLTELSHYAANRFAELSRLHVEHSERFTVCLSGGSTPLDTYALLAAPPLSHDIPWHAIHIFWGDERCIPLSRPDNHYTMASELMLSKVPVPPANIHRMRGEADNPDQAAREYEQMLSDFFGLNPGEFPTFDLILLGMGADGHTASLFPGTPGYRENARMVVAHYVPQVEMYRLTLTLPVLNNAGNVIFLASGEAKAAALRRVWETETGEGGSDLPARHVRPSRGKLYWLVDKAAASGLPQADAERD